MDEAITVTAIYYVFRTGQQWLDRSGTIDIRVGNEGPFTNTAGGVIITANTLCGTISGPTESIQWVICNPPIEGKFITIQQMEPDDVGGASEDRRIIEIRHLKIFN